MTIQSARYRQVFAAALLTAITALPVLAQEEYPATPQIKPDGTAVLVEDYASLPLSTARKDTDPYPPPLDRSAQLGRVNWLRSEPAGAPLAGKRFFVTDQNGILYILDKATKKFTPYIDVGKLYAKFVGQPPLGLGLVSLAFDPDYAHNGRFYTVHTEKAAMAGSRAPDGATLPGLDLRNFKATDPINPPAGGADYESVLTEWTDTNIRNDTFEGTSREILRVGDSYAIHPMADMIFDPRARRGSSDYGNLYIGIGDGAAGERAGPTHRLPQRLDAFAGKIIRITPDITLRPGDLLSTNGQYRIPSTGSDPNPFIAVPNARPEIFAYGFRNPHRLSWDVQTNTLIAADVGLHSWEEINIIVKGGNYGWAEREGDEQVFVGGPNGGMTGSIADPPVPFPANDVLTVDGLPAPVTPIYPVALYSHQDGPGMGSGFVYRGRLMPQLRGKYLFTDISDGRLFYADLKAMKAAGGSRSRAATIHEIQVMYKGPDDKAPVPRRLYDIVADGFKAKGGTSPAGRVMAGGFSFVGRIRGIDTQGNLAAVSGAPPLVDGNGVPYGGGRADVRLAEGGDDELYILCKTDGWVRRLVAITTPPPDAANEKK